MRPTLQGGDLTSSSPLQQSRASADMHLAIAAARLITGSRHRQASPRHWMDGRGCFGVAGPVLPSDCWVSEQPLFCPLVQQNKCACRCGLHESFERSVNHLVPPFERTRHHLCRGIFYSHVTFGRAPRPVDFCGECIGETGAADNSLQMPVLQA